jgi:protein-L-isoaspartate O-methyltransferase
MEERAYSYNKNFKNYDEARSGYPKQLYETIEKTFSINANSKLLEIGGGNGIATEIISKLWKSNITVIEPGNNFVNMMKNKFKYNYNIKIVNTTFEEYKEEELYDIIISANAFHWINKTIKYQKSHELLNTEGKLILFWNNYIPQKKNLFNEIQKIYTKYGYKAYTYEELIKHQSDVIDSRKNEIIQSGIFNFIEHKIFISNKYYDSNKYVKLLQTFSDHEKYDENFFGEIRNIINKNNNKIELIITANLEIGEKKIIEYTRNRE